MEWTDKDRQFLLSFKEDVDYDGIKIKEQVKKVLLNNNYIIHVLNNKSLESADAEPADYFGINILPYYLIPETQSNTKNFLCYTVGYKNLSKGNSILKLLQITFVVLCHQEDIIDKETGIPRHDLLGALIQDQFNYTTYMGKKIELISDLEAVTDDDYSTRTLVFEQITDNNVIKTRDKVSRFANKDIQAQV